MFVVWPMMASISTMASMPCLSSSALWRSLDVSSMNAHLDMVGMILTSMRNSIVTVAVAAISVSEHPWPKPHVGANSPPKLPATLMCRISLTYMSRYTSANAFGYHIRKHVHVEVRVEHIEELGIVQSCSATILSTKYGFLDSSLGRPCRAQRLVASSSSVDLWMDPLFLLELELGIPCRRLNSPEH